MREVGIRFIWVFLSMVTTISSICVTAVFADEQGLPTHQKEECEIYYQKARHNVFKADEIDPDGLFAGAKKGGLSGTASAYASLYQACTLRNKELSLKEKAH